MEGLHRRNRCSEDCQDHQFRIQSFGENKKHDVVASFCPKYRREPHPPEKTIPEWNNDKKYYTQAFVSGVEKKNLSLRDQHDHFDFQAQIKQSYEKNNPQISFPQPKDKTSFCSVCKVNYISYYYHICDDSHRENIKAAIYNSEIQKLCLNYESLWQGVEKKAEKLFCKQSGFQSEESQRQEEVTQKDIESSTMKRVRYKVQIKEEGSEIGKISKKHLKKRQFLQKRFNKYIQYREEKKVTINLVRSKVLGGKYEINDEEARRKTLENQKQIINISQSSVQLQNKKQPQKRPMEKKEDFIAPSKDMEDINEVKKDIQILTEVSKEQKDIVYSSSAYFFDNGLRLCELFMKKLKEKRKGREDKIPFSQKNDNIQPKKVLGCSFEKKAASKEAERERERKADSKVIDVEEIEIRSSTDRNRLKVGKKNELSRQKEDIDMKNHISQSQPNWNRSVSQHEENRHERRRDVQEHQINYRPSFYPPPSMMCPPPHYYQSHPPSRYPMCRPQPISSVYKQGNKDRYEGNFENPIKDKQKYFPPDPYMPMGMMPERHYPPNPYLAHPRPNEVYPSQPFNKYDKKY